MKQQVDITLKLSLWLDAELDQDDISTYVRASLPKAFGAALTDMENPVDILDIREEAAIYSPSDTGGPTRAPWAVYRLANDPNAYGSKAGGLIVTTADWEVEVTGVVHNEADACLIAASPKLLEALIVASHWIDAQLGKRRTKIQAQVQQAIADATRRAA